MAQAPKDLTPYASLRHFFGAELRQWRLAAGLSHDRLGAQINYSGDLVGKVEKADRMPTVALAMACDEALGTGGALSRLVALVEAIAERDRTAPVDAAPLIRQCPLIGQGSTVRVLPPRGAHPVNRFEFLVSTFGVSTGALLGPGEAAEAARLGGEDVTAWRRRLSRLYELDAEYGGGGVYELALQSLRKVRRLLHRASYSPATGEALQAVNGELTWFAGWLASETGREAEARYWWLEASHFAQRADDNRLLVAAMGSMSRQAYGLGQFREAIDLAQSAQQAAKPWGTPRLRSLLLNREALGHARAGDKHASWQALHQAETFLDAGRRDDDPAWLYFWDEADFASCQRAAALSLGDLPLAERCSRTALVMVRPEYPRNRISYLAGRAEVLIRQRSIDEAVATAAQAVEGASEVSSAMVDKRIAQTRAELTRYSANPRVAEFLDWSAEVLAAKTPGSASQV
ncbi:MAG: helix-turn-helix domain-containing protein [Pseudonocardiaceae bacterium]